jgi:hypothetical protein
VFSNPSAGVGSTADLELEAGNIPVGPNAKANERNQVKFGARQSRLFAGTSTPTSWGALTSYVEGDFYGAAGNESVSNSNGLRVRHAYGTLGGLLAGQTWTTFSDVDAYPETVDFGGPVGRIFARQAQVRWTQPFSSGQWSIALENPETVATLPNGTQFRADDDRLPDLAGIVRFNTGFGKYSIAGVARQYQDRAVAASMPRNRRFAPARSKSGGTKTSLPTRHGAQSRKFAVGECLGMHGFAQLRRIETVNQPRYESERTQSRKRCRQRPVGRETRGELRQHVAGAQRKAEAASIASPT